jgi:hypothetical protein
MSDKTPADKIPLLIHLPAELALRLQSAADTQKRPVAELVVELLNRHLPRPQTGGGMKGKIPYS